MRDIERFPHAEVYMVQFGRVEICCLNSYGKSFEVFLEVWGQLDLGRKCTTGGL